MKYTVRYISNKCSDTDELANKPHESVAKSILTLLQKHNEIKHSVIGVEGTWGAGKSQVIAILEKMTKDQVEDKKFIFHTYDIWSTQEDLTRRSFLDSLLSFAVNRNNAGGFRENNDNEANLAKLNATTTIHSTKTFPVVRLFYGIALLIPLLIFVITMIEYYFGYNENAAWSYDKLRGFISLIFTLFALVVFVIEAYTEYNTVSKEDELNNLSKLRRLIISISRILYLYKGKDIEKEDHETIIRDEPSVSRFKSIFNGLKESLRDNTILVIVFDNMDRLCDRSKLMSVWTLLHTFFAESDNNGKIWAIVPYDKNQLAALMGQEIMKTNEQNKGIANTNIDVANEFLSKTFFTSFYIPEPIMTSWKKFLNEKLNEAFQPAIENEERNVVSLIFGRTNKHLIRPRDIINFVNRLVTLYTQHQYEEVSLSALAIYSQFENEFREDAIGAILNHRGFKAFLPLFNSRTELTKQLASIYYNVKTEKAIEVVLGNAITGFLSSDFNSESEYESEYVNLSSNSAFKVYIEEYFNDVNLEWDNLKPQNLFYILKQDNVSKSTKSRIYTNVAENVENYFKTDFSSYSNWMEWALLNCNLQNSNKIIKGIIEISSDSLFENYQNSIIGLLLLKEKREELSINLDPRNISDINELILFFRTLKEHNANHLYAQCNIRVPEELMLDFVRNGTSAPRFNNNVEKLYNILRLLSKNNYEFVKFNEYINHNANIGAFQKEDIARIYKVFDVINQKIVNVPSYTNYNLGVKDIPEYYAACIHSVRNSDANVLRSCFSHDYSKEDFIPILARYVSLKDVLYMAIKSGSDIAINLCKDLLLYPGVEIGDVNYYLDNFKKIAEFLGEDDNINALYNKLDFFADKDIEINIEQLSDYWIDSISKDIVTQHALFKRLLKKYLSFIDNMSKEQWMSVFEDSNPKVSHIIQRLDVQQFMNKEVWNQQKVCEVVNELYSNYLQSKASINTTLFELWEQNVTNVALANMVNFAIDNIESPNKVEDSRFIEFVRKFIKHSKRIESMRSADSFFDDYLSRFYGKTSSEYHAQFTMDNEKVLLSIIAQCNKDRKEEFCRILNSVASLLKNGTPAKETCVKLAEKISELQKHD